MMRQSWWTLHDRPLWIGLRSGRYSRTNNWDLPFLGSIGLLLFGAIMAYWMKPNEPLPGTELGAVGKPA